MNTFKSFAHSWAWVMLITYCVVGVIYPVIGTAALVCMLAPVVVAFFRGRIWCGSFCPRGSFNDNILGKISRNRAIPGLFKKVWFKMLFLTILMSGFAVQLVLAWGSAAAVGGVFVRMIIITTSLAIILGIVYNRRTWCVICPMGTLAHYASKVKAPKKQA